MVHHQINNQIDPTLIAGSDKLVKIRHRSIVRIDHRIVHHIILVISVRRHDRHQPDTGDPQIGVR